ncbi:hypothetical protein As57867_007441, partial [Aphanomyces stellatus]
MGQVIASTTTHGKKKVVLVTPRGSLESDDANDENQRDISFVAGDEVTNEISQSLPLAANAESVEYTMTALPILSPRSHEGVVADNNLTNNPNGAELWIEDANEATTAYVPNEGDVIDEWRGNGEATTQADQEAYPYYYDEGTGQYYFDYNASATTNDGGGDVPPSETLGSSHVEEYVMADLPTTTSPNGPSSDVINGATGDEATTFEATTSIFSGDKHEMGQVIASTTT